MAGMHRGSSIKNATPLGQDDGVRRESPPAGCQRQAANTCPYLPYDTYQTHLHQHASLRAHGTRAHESVIDGISTWADQRLRGYVPLL